MELAAEIRVIVVERHVVIEAANLRELHALVERNLRLRGAHLERRVPRAAIGRVEAAAEWMRVREGGVDDAVVGDAEEELVHADAGKQIVLREETVVGGVVEIEEMSELRVVRGDGRKHAP